jgi:hypothetical protein
VARFTGIPQIDDEIARFRPGACVPANDAFVRQLRSAGLVACCSDRDRNVVAIVEHDGQRFSVDFDRDLVPVVQLIADLEDAA